MQKFTNHVLNDDKGNEILINENIVERGISINATDFNLSEPSDFYILIQILEDYLNERFTEEELNS